MSRPERQYCVTRRQLLAVVRAVQHFHPYLYGRRFTIRTDHAALRWLLSFRSPEGQGLLGGLSVCSSTTFRLNTGPEPTMEMQTPSPDALAFQMVADIVSDWTRRHLQSVPVLQQAAEEQHNS